MGLPCSAVWETNTVAIVAFSHAYAYFNSLVLLFDPHGLFGILIVLTSSLKIFYFNNETSGYQLFDTYPRHRDNVSFERFISCLINVINLPRHQ